MSDDKLRDETTDRLLRQAFRGRHGAVTPECVDVESLAAWVDGGLDPAAAQRIELHLSSCARCQAVLATIAGSEPVGSAASTAPAGAGLWHRWSIKWLAPVAAGIGAVLVWAIMRPEPVVPGDAPISVARVEERGQVAAPAESTTAVPAPEPAAEPVDTPKVTPRPETSEKVTPLDAGPGDLTRMRDEATSNALSGQRPFIGLNQPPPAPAAPAPPPPPPAVAEARSIVTGQPPPAQQGAERSVAVANEQAAPPQLVRGEPTSPAEINVVAEFGVGVGATLGQASARGAGGRGGAGRSAVADARQEAAAVPVEVFRWRVLVNGRVERQILGATSFTAVDLDAQTFITGGASPSTTVCWLVGRGGVVLRAIDGERFTRVSLPAGIEPASITASSALEARIVATNGRVLTTTDGGASWR